MAGQICRYAIAVIGIVFLLSSPAAPQAAEPPWKIDEPTAERLAAEGYDHGIDQKWFDYDPGMGRPFFVFYGLRVFRCQSMDGRCLGIVGMS